MNQRHKTWDFHTCPEADGYSFEGAGRGGMPGGVSRSDKGHPAIHGCPSKKTAREARRFLETFAHPVVELFGVRRRPLPRIEGRGGARVRPDNRARPGDGVQRTGCGYVLAQSTRWIISAC